MADMILLAKAAEDKGIGADHAFKHKLAFDRKKLLMTTAGIGRQGGGHRRGPAQGL